MARIFSMALILIHCFCPSLYASNSNHANDFIGTVVEVSGDRVVVAVPDNLLVRQMAFSLERNKLSNYDGAVAGDSVVITYMGPLLPDSVGDTDVRSWGVDKKEMNGILLSLDESQVVVQPMPDDPLAGQVEELMFLRNNEDLKRDIGVSVGDSVSVTYVRDVIPGNPPQIEAKNWGVYVDLDAWEEELIKNMEES